MYDDNHDTANEAPQREDVLELTAFTLTAEQAAERFREAGFPRDARTVGRWCKAGELQATRQTTKNGLSRYLISTASVDAKIEKLRRERDADAHPHVYTAANGDAGNVAVPTPRHYEDMGAEDVSSSSDLISYKPHPRQGEELAELRGRLKEKEEQARRDAAAIEKLRDENGGLRIALGQAKGRSEVLESQLRLLQAPKPAEPETPPPAPPPKSGWRRIFGRR
jgi:hypothetical protein